MYTFKKITSERECEIKKIIREAFAAPPWCDDWKDESVFSQYLADIMGNANSLCFGLYDGEKLIALVTGRLKHWFDGIEYNIDDVCVSPEYQGKGVGSALMSEIEKYAEEHDFKMLSLLTYRHAPAYKFYVKNDFEEKEGRVFLIKDIR